MLSGGGQGSVGGTINCESMWDVGHVPGADLLFSRNRASKHLRRRNGTTVLDSLGRRWQKQMISQAGERYGSNRLGGKAQGSARKVPSGLPSFHCLERGEGVETCLSLAGQKLLRVEHSIKKNGSEARPESIERSTCAFSRKSE